MKHYIPLVLAVSIGFVIVSVVLAQSSDFRINSWTISNGGGNSQKDNYNLAGAIGQVHAGNVSKNGNFTVSDGFWSTAPLSPTNPSVLSLYLPVLAKAPTPTPTSTPPPGNQTWQLLGGEGLSVKAILVRNNQLFAGVRAENNQPGGLYKRAVSPCTAGGLTRVDLATNAVFDIAFQGISKGVIAPFDTKPYYSSDGGVTWIQSVSSMDKARTVGVASDGQFYIGTEAQGIYSSKDSGVTWQQQTQNRPAAINRVRLYQGALWIATHGEGVWTLSATSNQPSEKNNGLTGKEAREVYDFAFHEATGIYYIATFDGVYSGDGSAWQSFGLPGKDMLSVAIVGEHLYAGAHKDSGGGIWRRPRNASKEWEQVWNQPQMVPALFYDEEACKALLAATNNGVWIYR